MGTKIVALLTFFGVFASFAAFAAGDIAPGFDERWTSNDPYFVDGTPDGTAVLLHGWIAKGKPAKPQCVIGDRSGSTFGGYQYVRPEQLINRTFGTVCNRWLFDDVSEAVAADAIAGNAAAAYDQSTVTSVKITGIYFTGAVEVTVATATGDKTRKIFEHARFCEMMRPAHTQQETENTTAAP